MHLLFSPSRPFLKVSESESESEGDYNALHWWRSRGDEEGSRKEVEIERGVGRELHLFFIFFIFLSFNISSFLIFSLSHFFVFSSFIFLTFYLFIRFFPLNDWALH